jgi:aminoglycoside/choline kinase family phosphotransferase
MGRPYRMGDRLYKKAISVILHIKSKWSNNIELGKNLPRYSIEELLKEARLFIDWYLIKHRQIQVQAKDIDEFESIISNLFKIISPGFDTLVLRDYHVDNLFFLKGRGGGFKNIGLIDFQDALIGSATYDLVSLIEDVRWPVNRVPYKNKNLRDDLFDFFVSHGKLDEEQVNKEACFFSVQRNLKILGIFCRLKYRDGKESYIDYLKNAKNILAVHLSNPLMEDLNKWVRKFDSKIVEGS